MKKNGNYNVKKGRKNLKRKKKQIKVRKINGITRTKKISKEDIISLVNQFSVKKKVKKGSEKQEWLDKFLAFLEVQDKRIDIDDIHIWLFDTIYGEVITSGDQEGEIILDLEPLKAEKSEIADFLTELDSLIYDEEERFLL